MCTCMKVSLNSYYSWVQQKDVYREKSATDKLKERITTLFNENRQVYGSVKIQKTLERQGFINEGNGVTQCFI